MHLSVICTPDKQVPIGTTLKMVNHNVLKSSAM